LAVGAFFVVDPSLFPHFENRAGTQPSKSSERN
jgi:hypothetical protein